MLHRLTIENIILIDRLHIDFEDGLCVLSGETGAGKSILMDSLGLAMGGRSTGDLLRRDTDRASVSADFTLPQDHDLWEFLQSQDISFEDDQIILRRTLRADGRSRAYINDQPVSVSLLRQVGDRLVEIHGQHDERGLLHSAGHRKILDDYGPYDNQLASVRNNYGMLTDLQKQLAQETEKLTLARADEDYIRHNLAELDALAPKAGEEDSLSQERSRMMQGEQMSEGLSDILKKLLDKNGVDAALHSVIRRLGRMGGPAGDILDPVVGALDRAATETTAAIVALEDILRNLEFSPHDLENTEERLFALRAAARKHQCQVDALPDILAEFERQLRDLEYSDGEVQRLGQAVIAAEEKFHMAVAKLTTARQKSARELDGLVNAELSPLKMEKARFRTNLVFLDRQDWGADGGERVEFQISTNPGAPFGGLIKVASGGELSRFLLALKVVLARKTTVPTLIFDEIDRGVGGAVADAVGERLKRLAHEAQILVITHSPQVAARGRHHWLIEKSPVNGGHELNTTITALDDHARREEIARMLAGAKITDEARAAAARLIEV